LAAVRETILRLAKQHQLPAISENRSFAVEGGLMSYGSNLSDLVRRAPSYVDRILRGAMAAGRVSNRIRMIINLKTAKAIGLTIPKILLLKADKVIAAMPHVSYASILLFSLSPRHIP